VPVTRLSHFHWRAGLYAWLLATLSTLAAHAAFKASLQGLNAGSPTWIDGNLMGWRELDYIPCRVYFTGGSANNQSITIEFDHMRGTIPGVENLTGWTASPNVQIVSPPVLTAPIGEITWSYTFRVNVTSSQPGYIEFRSRLSAGAHLNVGSSLALRGSPALGTLQIHKPSPGPGYPDLAILKRGPANAAPGETIAYTITYTNKPTSTNLSVGVQVRDMLPAELDIVTNSVIGGMIVGNSVIWDLGDLPIGATGTITYRATLKPGVAYGTSFSNYAQILSSENDGNPADNASVVTTLVTFNRPPIARDDAWSVSEDAVLDVPAPGVLANDTDADGNPLTVALPRPVGPPSHGALIFNANGSFVYTPNANFNGVDTFTYHVTDGAATSAVAIVTITVGPVNDPPVAADDSYTTDEDSPLTISAPGLLANDSDMDGDTLTATLLAAPSHGIASPNPDGSFTYMPAANFNGPDSFTYRAVDGNGASSAATVSITVRPINDAPIANNDSYTADEDVALTVPAPGVLANDSDIDGEALTALLVASPSHGTVSLNPNGSFTYTPAADYRGPDSFTYKASDGALDSPPATVSITVRPVNDVPVANNDSYVTDEDTPLTVPAPGVLSNDSDIDDNRITVSLVTSPSHGTIALNQNGSFTYTPVADYHGPDSFTYKVNDGAMDSSAATVSIIVRPINDAPVANNDSYTTDEDTALTVPAPGILSNDSDIDGNPLAAGLITNPAHGTIALNSDGSFTYTPVADYHGPDSLTYKVNDGAMDSSAATVSIIVRPINDAPVANNDSYTTDEDTALTVPAPGILSNDSDIDGNPLAAGLITNPAYGTIALNSDGSFTYTPVADYHGPDSFTYKVNDGILDSALATVSIAVRPVADAPIAWDDSYSTQEDEPLVVAAPGVLANDTDADGDALSPMLAANPTNGTVALNPDGSFIYTPRADYNGPDSFTYRASEGALSSGIAIVRIIVRPINDAPVANSDSYVTDEDTPLTVPAPGILANDSDIDGNALSASLISNPAHGMIALNSDGSFTYTPVADYYGPDGFTYKVNDGALDSSPVTVSITVRPVADAPIAWDDSYSTQEDEPLVVAAPGVLANDTDADGDALSPVLVAAPTNGTVALNPDGSFTYIPHADYNGPDSFTYRASDGALLSDIATVKIQVLPQPDPQKTTDDQFSALEDTTLTISAPGVLANDVSVDAKPFLAVMVQPPLHGTVTLNGDGGFTYIPAPDFNGRDSFLYRAAALAHESLTSRVEIIVAPINDQPSFTVSSGHVTSMNSPLQTFANWATNIRSGPADEAVQRLAFELSADRPALFEVQPTISPDGTLAYKPMSGSYGTARVTVVLKDDGGIANGGIDTSIPQIFAITINAPPTASIVVPTNGSVFIAAANIPVLVQAEDPDGVVTNLDLFAGSNRLFSAMSAPYAFSWTNVLAGEYTLRARATDNLGATGDSAPVTITVLQRPPTLLLGPIVLNLQSGLFEQRVRVMNPTPLDYEAIRVLITDLTPDVTVYNRSGMTNGIPYVQPAASVPAGGSVDVIIEYYIPSRIPPNPTLSVELVQSSLPPEAPPGQMTQITRSLRLENHTFLLEWNSLRGRTYFIQYSDDMHTWKTVMPPVTGTGTRHQWIDNGPPKTDAFPVETVCRFYRLILAQ
jgi:uncharacterized repeat protein (TIGR01451 family)